MDNEKIVLPKETKVFETLIQTEQSANALFNFMKKKRYLLEIIRNKALIPRYVVEDVRFLNLNSIYEMYYPMVCFCDINLHKISPHLRSYGKYGIGFSKQWGIEKGIQAVHYLNHSCEYISFIQEAFNEGMNRPGGNPLKDYFICSLRYMKPIQGCNICHKEKKVKNFTDECEWRFLPQMIGDALKPAIPVKDNISVAPYNKAMKLNDSYWLKFDYTDIKYIIVPDMDSSISLIKSFDKLDISNEDKNILLTKIVNWQDFKGDV